MFAESGQTEVRATEFRQVVWPSGEPVVRASKLVEAETVDRGNDNPLHLRAGLLLAIMEPAGSVREYDPSAADGREVFGAVLEVDLLMTGSDGLAAARFAPIVRRGPVDPKFLLIDGDPLIGHAQAAAVRMEMKSAGFTFRDEA